MTNSNSALLALAERVEAATADHQADLLREAWALLFPKPNREDEPEWQGPGTLREPLYHHWKTSQLIFDGLLAAGGFLDAAMSLAPHSDGDTLVFCRSGNDGEGGNPDTFKAEVLVCSGLTSKLFTAVAATEPLARTAAFLRARSAQ